MRKKYDKSCNAGVQLEDKTRELSRAFKRANQRSARDRRAFLEQTRSVGILSPSGSWLIKNTAAGEHAVAEEELLALNESLCRALGIDPKSLCPKCSCGHPTTHQATHNDCQIIMRENQTDDMQGPGSDNVNASSGWDAIQGPILD
jgi:hypothetical protein